MSKTFKEKIEDSLVFLARRFFLSLHLWKKLLRRKKIFFVAACVFSLFIFWGALNANKFYKQYKFRTRFFESQENISPMSEEEAGKGAAEKCQELRGKYERKYSPQEISAVVSASREEKMILIGANPEFNSGTELNSGLAGQTVVIDTTGKNIGLYCFSFSGRLVVSGDGKIELGYNDFKDVSGNAVSASGGTGKIFGNSIAGSKRSGIFIDRGKWEIENNTIKNNGSYGVYGGYEAEIKLKGNFISGNEGYQVRLMRERKVYE